MLKLDRFGTAQIFINVLWIGCVIALTLGLHAHEGPLSDSNTLKLLERGIEHGGVSIIQPSPFQKLELSVQRFDGLDMTQFKRPQETPVFIDRREWSRVEALTSRLVAAENQNRGDAFYYTETGGIARATAFRGELFEYRNPFLSSSRPFGQRIIPILESDRVDRARPGWRILGQEFEVFLTRLSPRLSLEVEYENASTEGGVFVGREIVLRSRRGTLRLSIRPTESGARRSGQPTSEGNRLSIVQLDPQGQPTGQMDVLSSGDYFVYAGAPFVVYDTTTSARPSSPRAGQPFLLERKLVNGIPTPVHALGEATAGLLGIRDEGYAQGLLGALKPDSLNEITTTLDPELQNGAYALLKRTVEQINARHPVIPSRRASAAIINSNDGSILAYVGFPGVPITDLQQNRRIRVPNTAAPKNPATEVHMSGSTIKVLTVALGYLLNGDAMAELLPPSRNDLAIKQASYDAYGHPMDAPIGREGEVTPQARKWFAEYGTPSRVRPEFVALLQRAFLVNPVTVDSERYSRVDKIVEKLIPSGLDQFFDEDSLKRIVYPETSQFPMWDATSMDQVHNYALGEAETRLTTLRLAAILTSVATGRVVRPELFESVKDRAGVTISATHSGSLRTMDAIVPDLERRRQRMMDDEVAALRRVLIPGGTGNFYQPTPAGTLRLQYLGLDDSSTPQFSERDSRSSDFGKTGTADYGSSSPYQDSLFVYRHGDYVLAVWFEKADYGPNIPEADRTISRHPAHRFTHHIVSLLESLGQ